MRYVFLFLMILLVMTSTGQNKNSIILSSVLLDNNTRYHFKKYTKAASTLREFEITYYRQVGNYRNWFLGAGFGFRKVSVNEYDPVQEMDENVVMQPVSSRLAIRYEQFLGRKMKYYFDGGPGYNFGGSLRTVNANGYHSGKNKLLSSIFVSAQFGLQYAFTEKLSFAIGFSSLNDLQHSLVLNDRKVKFSNATFKCGLRIGF